MGTLEILVGMIASGKSTYADNKAKEGALIVNHDTLVKSIHGGDYQLYKEKNKPIYKSIEYSIITHGLSLDRHIIIDRTNHKRSTRFRYTSLAHALEAKTIATVFTFEDPEVHARRRYEKDSRGHSYQRWLFVAKQHAKEYQPVKPKVELIDQVRTYDYGSQHKTD